MAKKSKDFKELIRQNQQVQGRQKSLEELAKKIQANGLDDMPSKMVIEPQGTEKMSEVLRKFVAPYMATVKRTKDYRSLLDLAIIAWNISLMPEAKHQEMIDAIFEEKIFKQDKQAEQDVKGIIAELITRKNKYFADIKRFIVEFNLKDTGEDYHLSVASIDFDLNPEEMAQS
jgi:hypothetical protein